MLSSPSTSSRCHPRPRRASLSFPSCTWERTLRRSCTSPPAKRGAPGLTPLSLGRPRSQQIRRTELPEIIALPLAHFRPFAPVQSAGKQFQIRDLLPERRFDGDGDDVIDLGPLTGIGPRLITGETPCLIRPRFPGVRQPSFSAISRLRNKAASTNGAGALSVEPLSFWASEITLPGSSPRPRA